MQATTIHTITTEKGSPADANVIWSQHVNRWTWIAMGARSRNVIRTEDGLMVDIYLGAGFRKRRLVIKVNQSDLYDIEIGRVQSGTFTTPIRSKGSPWAALTSCCTTKKGSAP
jgi:hypothetical protein